MKDLFERWLASKAAALKPTSVISMRQMMANFFTYFKDRSAGSITTHEICEWMDWSLHRRKHKLLASTLNGHVRMAKEFLEWCVDDGAILANPIIPRKLPKLKELKPDKHPFTWEQYHRVMRAIPHFADKPWSAKWEGAICVGWHTGLRISDVAALAWANVNFDDGMITVWPKKKEAVREQLYIPIEPDLREMLLRLRNAKPQAQYVNYELYASYQLYRCELVREMGLICDWAGLPNHSFHSLRHGFVTRLINAGVDPIIIGAITGQSLEIIQEYSHVSTAAKMEAMAKSRQGQVAQPTPKLEIAV